MNYVKFMTDITRALEEFINDEDVVEGQPFVLPEFLAWVWYKATEQLIEERAKKDKG